MKYPKLLGKIIYILIYPLFRALVFNSRRVYVLIKINDRLLITQNWLSMQNEWALPGGGLKQNESLEAAAVREIKEELSLDINPNNLKQVGKYFRSRFGNVYYIFEYEFDKKPIINPGQEIACARLCTIEQLKELKIGEAISSVAHTQGWS